MQRSIAFTVIVVTTLASVLAAGAPAFATIYGAQGLISVPAAPVPPDGAIAIGATTFNASREWSPTRSVDWTWAAATLDVGLAGRGEMGITYLHRSGGGSIDGVGIFGKVLVVPEGALTPALSIGADGISGDLETTQAYLAATRRFNRERALGSVTVTAGGIYAWHREGLEVEDADVYGGVQLGLSKRLSIVGEWREKTAGFPSAGSGAMLMYGVSKYAIGIGALNTGNSDTAGFFIGAGFNISTLD